MMIQMFHLTKVHPSGVKVLDDAFFSAPSGSFTIIVGESRTGKSTVLKMLCGEEEPTGGTLRVDYKEVYKIPSNEKKEWLSDVGLILPDLKLFPSKTIEENILFPLQMKGATLEAGREALFHLLEVTGLKAKASAKPGDLSTGEQQMVMALRAMVFRPRLLLADEPFQGLDDKAVGLLSKFLIQLNQESTTIVLAVQQPQVLAKIRNSLKELPSVEWVQLKDKKLVPWEEG